MTKSDLILRLAEKYPHLLQRDIERIVNTVFDEISNALARNSRVELRGFGAFSVKQREARQGLLLFKTDADNVIQHFLRP